jgi:DNA adenine methylase
MKPIFPYFGSKRRVANIIWQGLGEVNNYVEPFAGSLAVLLANPKIPKIETVNDIDAQLVNFFRSILYNPNEVINYADYPVSELDLHARHNYLVSLSTDDFKSKMELDPDFFDPKMAGFWIYGISDSIGNNWLQSKGLKSLPILSSAGGGIHGLTFNIEEDLLKLQQRLKRVRICCGQWSRILSPAITYNNVGLSNKDITGVFLDPPYKFKNRDKVYKEESNIYNEVCEWAISNGDNIKLRIVVCGYEGDYKFPDTWNQYSWSSSGFGNLGDSRGKENSKREIIYFSPNCLSII